MNMEDKVSTNGVARTRILFVDDEPRILTSLRMLCRRHYDVRIADSGQAALELLREHPVDVMVSDQRMPGMTGIELLRAARELRPDTIRLLLTGYADLNAIIGSINEGEIFRFVSKPWSNEDLVATLADAAEASRVAAVHQAAPAPESGPEPGPESVTQGAASPTGPGVLLLDPQADKREALGEILRDQYRVFEASSFDQAVDQLHQHDIGVIISDVHVQGTRVVELLNLLKAHEPHLVSIIVTDRADAFEAIDLINRSQVYRFLIRPLRPIMCQISVRSALERHAALVRNPEQTRRYAAARIEKPVGLGQSLVERIRRMRERLQPNVNL